MKKYLTLVLSALMFVNLLAGCGSNNDDAEYLKDLKADKFVTLGQYIGIEVFVASPEISDEAVENALAALVLNHPKLEPVSGPGQAGDVAIIDFAGSLDGVLFPGGSAEGHEYTLGSRSFIADLCEGMIGMSVGDVWDIPVTFPEDYHSPDLAGKEAIFEIKMHSLERAVELSKINDEYVAWFTEGMYTTVDELREFFRANMEQDALMAFETEVSNQITAFILENSEFKPMPTAMVTRIHDAIYSSLDYFASMYGLDVETYLMYAGLLTDGKTAEDVLTDQAEQTARHYIAFQAIADREGLSITDEEVRSSIQELAEASGLSVEEYMDGMDDAGYREFLMIDRVNTFLTENAVIINQ